VLLSAFQALLARYSGDSDIVVGSPVTNRRTVEMESLVGLFVNSIAFRGDLSADPSFRTLLARNRNHVLHAMENGEAPLERVVERLNLERAPGRTPLFQTMFVMENGGIAANDGRMGGLRTSYIGPDVETARFEITLSLYDGAKGLEGVIDYGSDLFDVATIVRMGEHFEALLRGVLAQPDAPLSRIPLTTAAERAELLSLGNGGPALMGEGGTLHDLFALQAARTPEAIALVEPDAGGGLHEFTYAQALTRANGIAQRLHALGIGREHVVGVLADRSADAVLAVLGVLAAGAAYLPLDAGNPDERLRFLLDDAGARALLVPPQLRGRAEALAVAQNIAIPLLPTDTIAPADTAPTVERGERDAAYLIYTSGSTGTPKGVVIEHRGAVNLVRGFLARHR
ncbi:MAG: AMP-binding protein, partial [Methylotenera sp.]